MSATSPEQILMNEVLSHHKRGLSMVDAWRKVLDRPRQKTAAYAQLREQTLRGAEVPPPVSSAAQPKTTSQPKVIPAAATQSVASAVTSGYAWSPAGGWTREGPDPLALRRAAALSTLQRMMPVPAPDGARVDSVKLSERALALMKERDQSIDPNSDNYLPNYKSALIEVSK